MVTALKSRNHSLENLLRMSQQTCEALRSRYESVYSELDGKLSRQDKQLKHVYSVFQKEIEEKNKSESERERLQIENELLKSGRYTEKADNGAWIINSEKLAKEVSRIHHEREQERRAQEPSPTDYQFSPTQSMNISFEEINPPMQMPMPNQSRPGSNYGKLHRVIRLTTQISDVSRAPLTSDLVRPPSMLPRSATPSCRCRWRLQSRPEMLRVPPPPHPPSRRLGLPPRISFLHPRREGLRPHRLLHHLGPPASHPRLLPHPPRPESLPRHRLLHQAVQVSRRRLPRLVAPVFRHPPPHLGGLVCHRRHPPVARERRPRLCLVLPPSLLCLSVRR